MIRGGEGLQFRYPESREEVHPLPLRRNVKPPFHSTLDPLCEGSRE